MCCYGIQLSPRTCARASIAPRTHTHNACLWNHGSPMNITSTTPNIHKKDIWMCACEWMSLPKTKSYPVPLECRKGREASLIAHRILSTSLTISVGLFFFCLVWWNEVHTLFTSVQSNNILSVKWRSVVFGLSCAHTKCWASTQDSH